MKQTAVEKMIQYFIEQKNNGASHWCINDLLGQLHQAKAMEKEQKIAFGKKCFYKGFEKAENDDANCFTAWREEAPELLTFKSE